MKIFSKRVQPKMRADTFKRATFNILLAAATAFVVSLAIPPGDIAQMVFALLFVLMAVGLDARDRLIEVFRQNRTIIERPPVYFISAEEAAEIVEAQDVAK